MARESGQLVKYTLPHISIEKKVTVRGSPEQLALNCNSTRLSIVDREGIFMAIDLEKDGALIAPEKRDVWSVLWSNDNPILSAHMEKNRLYVMRDSATEDPVLSAAYLCDFADLEIKVRERYNCRVF